MKVILLENLFRKPDTVNMPSFLILRHVLIDFFGSRLNLILRCFSDVPMK